MRIMRNYTIIPNEILGASQLSVQARYLLCVLLKYCGQDEWCFPSQETLAKEVGCSARYIRRLLEELLHAGVIVKTRRGFNRSNTYRVAKSFVVDRNGSSCQLGSKFPLHQGNTVPTKSTYLKGKDKRSLKGLENLRKTLVRKGLTKSVYNRIEAKNCNKIGNTNDLNVLK